MRIKEDNNNFEEEIQNLQDEIKELEIHYSTVVQNYEHEL